MNLPADIIRLTALYLNSQDICCYSRLNKKIWSIIGDWRFLRDLGHQRLTDFDDRLPEDDEIFEELQLQDIIKSAMRGYEKRIKYLTLMGTNEMFLIRGAIWQASIGGYLNIIEYFYDNYSKYLQGREALYKSLLINAIKYGYLDIVKYFTDPLHPDRKIVLDDYENNQLKLAVEYVHLPIIKYLLENGQNIHVYNDIAIILACRTGKLDIVKYLISQGANIDVNEGQILIEAIDYNYFDIVKYLLDPFEDNTYQGINVNSRQGRALEVACEKNRLDIVKYLLELPPEHRSDIHARNGLAIWLAARANNLTIVKYLLSKGALDNLTLPQSNISSSTAAEIAADNGHTATVECLVEYNSKIHNLNEILRRAGCKGHLDIVIYMIFKGADIASKNNYEIIKTAVNDHIFTLRYLNSFGAIDTSYSKNQLKWTSEKYPKIIDLFYQVTTETNFDDIIKSITAIIFAKIN